MIESRVEKHIIRKSNSFFDLLLKFCHKSKNLYNHANYLILDKLKTNDIWLRYQDLDKILRDDLEFPDYKEMPTAKSAKQLLRLLDKNWKSYFSANKDYKKKPNNYLGKPKPPKFLPKKGYFVLTLTNQDCRLKENTIRFPKVFEGFSVKPLFIHKSNFKSFQQVRFIPHRNNIVLELVYNIEVPENLPDNKRYLGIDIGINNLATCSNNLNKTPFIINGKPLKSINQYYNKKKSRIQEICKRMNNRYTTKRLDRLTEKRNRKIEDYLHKASRFIVDYCVQNDIRTIIIGKNKGWKQEVNLSKRINQNFVSIPFNRFIEMIQYKAKEYGITVILTEESYTSRTSFIDDELPIKENYDKSRRKYRGLFVSNNGLEINADLNGSYQIIRKVVPIKWNRGCVLHPIVVNFK